MQLHTMRPNTVLLQIWLEMKRSTWAMYRLLRWSPTASPSHCQSPPSWRSLKRWEWSVLDSEMASELELEMVWGMVTEMVSELEMAIGNADGKQIDWLGTFVLRRSTLSDWLLFPFVYWFVSNGRDSRPGGVLIWLEVRISLCQGLWCNLPLL